MKQEDKELLLKDLCARLPYKCRIWIKNNNPNVPDETDDVLDASVIYRIQRGDWMVKPYLRPLSSMTDEEKEEFQKIKLSYHFDEDGYILLDWFNEHHFDYRGLIEKGLALEATEDMYNI